MSTKLTIKICLLFLTGLAINRLPSDMLADPQASEAVSLGTAKHRPLKKQNSICAIGIDFCCTVGIGLALEACPARSELRYGELVCSPVGRQVGGS